MLVRCSFRDLKVESSVLAYTKASCLELMLLEQHGLTIAGGNSLSTFKCDATLFYAITVTTVTATPIPWSLHFLQTIKTN